MSNPIAQVCKIPGCPNPCKAKGWCSKHCEKARRHGDPLGGRSDTPHGEPLAFFYAHVDDVTERCIEWPYATNGFGYGRLHFGGRDRAVHVLACERHHGPMPEPKMYALHAPTICHNRLCFNWRHLRWGNQKQNMEDCVLDDASSSKLTRNNVADIRARHATGGISLLDLAAEFRVGKSAIWRIVTGRSWKV